LPLNQTVLGIKRTIFRAGFEILTLQLTRSMDRFEKAVEGSSKTIIGGLLSRRATSRQKSDLQSA
jgi:hypothetical protein